MRSGNPAGAVNVTCAGVAGCNQKKNTNTHARGQKEEITSKAMAICFSCLFPIYSRVPCWRGFINHKKGRKNNAARWWLSLGHGQGDPVWTLLPCHDIIIWVKCFKEKTRPCFLLFELYCTKRWFEFFYFFIFGFLRKVSQARAVLPTLRPNNKLSLFKSAAPFISLDYFFNKK